jgi:hypothetical protein
LDRIPPVHGLQHGLIAENYLKRNHCDPVLFDARALVATSAAFSAIRKTLSLSSLMTVSLPVER